MERCSSSLANALVLVLYLVKVRKKCHVEAALKPDPGTDRSAHSSEERSFAGKKIHFCCCLLERSLILVLELLHEDSGNARSLLPDPWFASLARRGLLHLRCGKP